MSVQTPHPDSDRLAAYSLGMLNAESAEAVAAHLRACPECECQVDAVPEDAFLILLRRAATTPALPFENTSVEGRARTPPISNQQAAGPEVPPELSTHPHYRVLEWLGAGGMGTVFKAEHRLMERVVALKVINRQLTDRPELLDRFRREVKALARLSHPNIVSALDAEQIGNTHFLVMEFVEGTTLARLVETQGPLDPARAVEYVRQAALGLQHAFEADLVHRDLKPQNLMLTTRGEVKILDFGLARMVSEADTTRSLTEVGTIMGTPDYLAPEQAMDARQADVRADVYSLGCTLYFLLTGQPPFPGGTVLEQVLAHREKTPRPLSEFRDDLPAGLQAVVDRMLAKAPGSRYQTPAEAATVLAEFVGQVANLPEPTLVRQVGNLPHARRRRRRLGLVAVLAPSVLAAIGGAGYLLFPRLVHRQGGDPVASNADRPDLGGTAVPDREKLGQQVHQLFLTHCHRCHGQDGSIEGGFNYLLDRDQLVARRKIAPGDPGRSRLLRRVADGEMPPEDVKERPRLEDVAALRQWIEAGAPAFTAAPASSPFIPAGRAFEVVRADLEKRSKDERLATRYLTLTHLRNAGLSDDEMQTYRNGVSKLLNSLSWNQKIVVPAAVDAEKTVLRINLNDYRWGEREWQALLAQYPYAVDDGSEAQKYCVKATGCAVPLLRGDWFVAAAAVPPLYHDLLQLPLTDVELEKTLRVDVAADVKARRVARVAFNNSGISRSNRMIERHETSYGAYWKSYDFKENTGDQNLFERPLGPGDTPLSFRHAGGEIIFNLPNGLQAYVLVNAQGTRIDKAPTSIVSDPKRPDRAVDNGVSCMSCHVRGIILKDDQVRAHVEKNRAAFSNDDLETIQALYPPAEKMRALQEEDVARFQKAAVGAAARPGITEPIAALVQLYEAPLTVRRAAAELGLTTEEFRRQSTRHPIAALGGPDLQDGTVPREVFVSAFMDPVNQWKLGTPVTASAIVNPADPGASGRYRLPVIPEPRLSKAEIEVPLPEPVDEIRTGGGGRFVFLPLKKAKKLAIFDVSEARIVHQIDLPTAEVLFAGGRDTLMIVIPGQKLIQRWSLKTFKREKIAPVPDDRKVLTALMGSNSAGPLLLWTGDTVILFDVERMEVLRLAGTLLRGTTQWGYELRVSADGQTFMGWTPRITGQRYGVMRLAGGKTEIRSSPDGHSHAEHWALPGPTGNLFFRFGGGLYDSRLRPLSPFKAVVMPTEDPRFFLALREQAGGKNQVTICTTADRREIFTVTDLPRMTSSSQPNRHGLFWTEPRVRYLPSGNVLVVIPDGARILVRRFNLMESLDRSGENYLFVLSEPVAEARAGMLYTYPMVVRSKSGGLRFTLDAGPEGMNVSGSGLVKWQVPEGPGGKSHPVIVTVRDAMGKEIQHAFDVVVE